MKIYCFCNTPPNRDEWYVVMAIAEDGHCLASHVCSGPAFFKGDIGFDEDNDWSGKRELFEAHCPDGFECEWVDNPRAHEGLAAAFAKNQQLPKNQPANA
ncbi:MAG TPA: hypothetical protein VHP62_01910 [Usitatibacter sp.]|jgi:hypothetical protein|nr:hypothetical protein [Usitatibacter sp.]